MSTVVETDYLIVGAGPSGGAMACFLGQNGLKGIVISRDRGTADTPRAHLVNPFTFECLRDIGLEDEGMRLGITGKTLTGGLRWCRSMVGEEYGRTPAFGGQPENGADIKLASPCEYADFPQSYMEPVLVKYATHHGFDFHFNTELVDAKRRTTGFECTVRGRTTKLEYTIHTKYLFAADGARSAVARAFPFNFLTEPRDLSACNILIKADLSHLMHSREADLHFIMKPDRKWQLGHGACLRMVRPWHEWIVMVVGTGSNPLEGFTKDSPELVECIKELIGDDTIDVEVLGLSPWSVRQTVAEKFSLDRDVFLAGDAAHRHPPAYGLGSNTCVQDAYNLAWKVAYVAKGYAGPALLDSYNDERQPVGADLVIQANQGVADHLAVWEALGMFEPPEAGMKIINDLYEPTPVGVERRQILHKALERRRREAESIGLGMNQWYTSSAIYLDDETTPRPTVNGDVIVKPLITTYPGTRLPHAWLDISTRRKEISTIDLAGHGSFCLLYGPGGKAWKEAATKIAAATGVPIKAYGIGFGLDYIDLHRRWYEVREIEDDGCVLVRPDRYVAWRAKQMVEGCEDKLLHVLNKVLSRN
ncbi:FAD binding domain-containing protein [Stachybotrys elegans]|uniref:FAD binding domain-containing protein n=1 Tax=Stachybotrys elegans TaxID=80388 RepID=A0A8K0SWT4_9HYPO|nr:FAD binding domain-containing protein [Stachybotrys elegans]